MHGREGLMCMVRHGDAVGFARQLGLDPDQTQRWFDLGLIKDGYGAEVITALGTHMLDVLTRGQTKGDEHG